MGQSGHGENCSLESPVVGPSDGHQEMEDTESDEDGRHDAAEADGAHRLGGCHGSSLPVLGRDRQKWLARLPMGNLWSWPISTSLSTTTRFS